MRDYGKRLFFGVQRLNWLIDEEEAAALVKKWSFSGHHLLSQLADFPDPSHPLSKMLGLGNPAFPVLAVALDGFTASLSSFVGVVSLTLVEVDISSNLLKAICSLPSLRHLTLERCDLLRLEGLRPLPLESFSWTGDGLHHPYNSLEKTPLFTIDNMKRLKFDHPGPYRNVLQGFFSYVLGLSLSNYDCLVHLVLVIDHSAHEFSLLLERTPRLLSLDIEAPSSFSQINLAPSTIPALKSVSCPTYLAHVFFYGRPIHSATLRNSRIVPNDSIIKALNAVSESGGVIRDITLPSVLPSSNAFSSVYTSFPHIRHLSVTIQSVGKTYDSDEEENPFLWEESDSEDEAAAYKAQLEARRDERLFNVR